MTIQQELHLLPRIITPEEEVTSAIPMSPVISNGNKYEQAADYSRNAGNLAKFYGYPSIEDFAGSLPSEAQVLDVGAARSRLGPKTAALRPDISWLSVDLAYDERIKDNVELNTVKPPNLIFLRGDAINLNTILGGQQFDRVFSYYMLPYITLTDRPAGIQAARNMLQAVKPGGTIAIGPSYSGNGILGSSKASFSSAPQDEAELEEKAEWFVDRTRMPLLKTILTPRRTGH
jgi:hypothetical protein